MIGLMVVILMVFYTCGRSRFPEAATQIYRRTPMPKCNFNEVALQVFVAFLCLLFFRTPFPKNTSRRLLLLW